VIPSSARVICAVKFPFLSINLRVFSQVVYLSDLPGGAHTQRRLVVARHGPRSASPVLVIPRVVLCVARVVLTSSKRESPDELLVPSQERKREVGRGFDVYFWRDALLKCKLKRRESATGGSHHWFGFEKRAALGAPKEPSTQRRRFS
jgi:hypothetical protein